MAGFERKWSDSQRRAVTYACTVGGMRPGAAVKFAAAGQLTADGGTVDPDHLDALEPFNPPVTTVREWVATERRRVAELRRRRLEPDAILDSARGNLAQLARAVDRETERALERQRSRPADPVHLQRLARAVREIGEAARSLETRSNAPAAPADTGKPAPAAPGLLEHLAAQSRR